jgi:spermatogenesis-associated protein 2
MASSAPCNSCNIYQSMPNQQHHYYNPQPPPPVPLPPQSSYHVPCSVHPHNNSFSNQQYSANYGQIPTTIPHSKSLDYYEPNPMIQQHMNNNGGFPNNHHHHTQHQHRHSVPDQAFDYNPNQSQSHYDCVDGDHQCNLNTMQSYNNHPYNVSGNRVPLPYNISNELGGTPYPPQQQHLPPPPLPPSSCYANNAEQATYYSRLQHPAQRELSYNDHQFNGSVKNVDYYCPVLVNNPNQQQPHYIQNNVTSPVVPMETLIDFDQHNGTSGGLRNNTYYEERAGGKHDKQQQSDSFLPTTIKSHHNGGVHHHYQQQQQQTAVDLPPPLFAKNKTTRTNEKYAKTNNSMDDYNKQYTMAEKVMRNMNLSDFDSFEDDNSSSQPRSNKNMDGIGNYESWNYVFRNLEQQGKFFHNKVNKVNW